MIAVITSSLLALGAPFQVLAQPFAAPGQLEATAQLAGASDQVGLLEAASLELQHARALRRNAVIAGACYAVLCYAFGSL